MITEIYGTDLFEVPGDALAHGVNIKGFMGGGVAFQLASRWPRVESMYQLACREDRLKLGGFYAVPLNNAEGMPQLVYNLATQLEPGRDARLSAIEVSVDRMVEHAKGNNYKKIVMPRIGCGIGGLRWDDVKFILEGASKDLEFVVCSL